MDLNLYRVVKIKLHNCFSKTTRTYSYEITTLFDSLVLSESNLLATSQYIFIIYITLC